MEKCLPGIAVVARSVAESRREDRFDEFRSVLTKDELKVDSQIQELLKKGSRQFTPHVLLDHLELYCNFELHRRKTFWVDESLAWMLAHTQVDADGSLLRLPFASYTLVFTDRHTLGVAERALASVKDCPLPGQVFAVLCGYVIQVSPDGSRIKVGLTFDTLAGDHHC